MKVALKKMVLCLLIVAAYGGWFLNSFAQAETHRPMLPHVYHQQNVVGWWMSEKLDGVRAYWDGERLWSKNGHPLSPPDQFIDGFPPFPLEGELWAGRNSFEQTASIVLKMKSHNGWLKLRYGVFDVPAEKESFRQRMFKVKSWLEQNPAWSIFIIEQTSVRDQQHLNNELVRIESLGGEGLIVRDPDALYATGRSMSILKVKSFEDAEAIVVAHLPGKGKHKGRLGALMVEKSDGVRFRIGSGFSDAERDNPPPLGTVISYKFYGRYQSGLPKFPVYLRIREDSLL